MSDEDNSKSDLLKLGVIGGALVMWGGVEIPDWWMLAGTGLGAALVVGIVASGKIDDLLEDPRSKRLVQINANGEPLAGWKLSPDKMAEMDVKWGPLFTHDTDSKFDVFECYAYNEDANVAVGTWRRSLPGSEIVGQHDVDDVLNVIGDTRGRLEVMAREGRELKMALPNIVRRIDYERMQMQNAALDPNRDMPSGGTGLEDVLREELPAELQPGSIKQGDLSSLLESNQEDAGNEWDESFDLLLEDDTEALEPVGELANDGGAEI